MRLLFPLVALTLISLPAIAADISAGFCDSGHLVRGAEIAVSKGCLGCHTLENKRVGPSYREIARKYAGDSAASARLAHKIKEGGSGSFGNTAMPPNPVSDEEAQQLAKWVLSL